MDTGELAGVALSIDERASEVMEKIYLGQPSISLEYGQGEMGDNHSRVIWPNYGKGIRRHT